MKIAPINGNSLFNHNCSDCKKRTSVSNTPKDITHSYNLKINFNKIYDKINKKKIKEKNYDSLINSAMNCKHTIDQSMLNSKEMYKTNRKSVNKAYMNLLEERLLHEYGKTFSIKPYLTNEVSSRNQIKSLKNTIKSSYTINTNDTSNFLK